MFLFPVVRIKSAVLMATPTSTQKNTDVEWTLLGDTLPPSDELAHVGHCWCHTHVSYVPDSVVGEHIKIASKCVYSLIGAGLHGNNGAGPKVCLQTTKDFCSSTSVVWT